MPALGNNDGTPENLEMLQALQEMLVKLSHIEVSKFIDNKRAVIIFVVKEDKMRIQQRWNHLAYRDASVKPVVRIPSPFPSLATTLSVSPSVEQSVSYYRDRFNHHLKLKGAVTGLDWESSKLIEE